MLNSLCGHWCHPGGHLEVQAGGVLSEVLLAIGFNLPAVLAATVFSCALPGDRVENSDAVGSSRSFDWVKFFRPDAAKVVLTLLLPAVIALLVTLRTVSILDFYWYLLTPMVPYYDGTRITMVFNTYVLLWIPFYLAACVAVTIIGRIRSR